MVGDAVWEKIAPLLPGKPSDPGATAKDNRLFLEAVLWRVRTGVPWRDLPSDFGNWNSVFQRFRRWVRRFPVGASPTRQTLQPEATGAVMEVTKWLKPSDSGSRIGDSASVQAATRVNAEQASKRTMCRPTRRPFRGRLIRLGE